MMKNNQLLIYFFVLILLVVSSLLYVYLQPYYDAHNLAGPDKPYAGPKVFVSTSNVTRNNTDESIENHETSDSNQIANVHTNSIVDYITDQIRKAETLKSLPATNKNMLKRYFMFNRKKIFQSGMDTQFPQELIRNYKDLSKELASVISFGIASLNNGSMKMKVLPTYQFTEADFLHGLFRIEMGVGIHYELVYKSHVKKPKLFRSTLFRPFAPVYSIQTSFSEEAEIIYFIVPLYERLDKFKVFIEVFKKVAVPDKNVHLTVVYYGSSDLTEVEKTLELLHSSTGFGNYKLVKIVNEPFARGRARDHGAKSIDHDGNKSRYDPLMFFCDVDMAFTPAFLNQCRVHATAGKSVFYPIVFSLYNPEVVYGKSLKPPQQKQLQHSIKNGFWRSFGYGMSCQYLSDYKSIGGFDLSITGWGSEDVRLVQKFVESNVSVVRTPVDSLFHRWHEKICNKSLPAEQYSSCLSSRALTEGSSLDLGLKYFELKEKLKSLQNN